MAITIPIFADLVAPVAAKRAVRINTAVCIALFETSSIVAIYMNVPTTAMKESQKSKNLIWIDMTSTDEYQYHAQQSLH